MRIRKVLLISVPTAAAAAAAAAVALAATEQAATIPGCTYSWAQPGTASTPSESTQPPSWVPSVPMQATIPGCSYSWAQPGTASTPSEDTQPPAFVPIAAARGVPSGTDGEPGAASRGPRLRVRFAPASAGTPGDGARPDRRPADGS